jgi:hypothetical protein
MRFKRLFLILACGGVFMAAQKVHADTRDDVVAGVQRCGVIHDNRVWLDCVYGAQQPMRAELGLPPAPEFQQRLVPPVQLGTAMPMQLTTAQPAARAASRPTPRKKPSFWSTLIGSAPPETVSRMASYRYDKDGAFIVSLENGQEWRQADVVDGTVHWIKPPSAYTVTVNPGAFGSFILQGGARQIKRLHPAIVPRYRAPAPWISTAGHGRA